MSRTLKYLVATLLIPALLLDPRTALALTHPTSPSITHLDQSAGFESNALTLLLAGAIFASSNVSPFSHVVQDLHRFIHQSPDVFLLGGVLAMAPYWYLRPESFPSEKILIQIYERRLSGNTQQLRLWNDPHALYNARVLTRYAIKQTGWSVDRTLFDHVSKRWFKSVHLGGMLTYLFNDNIYDAVANAYPELAYDPKHPKRLHTMHPWDAARVFWGDDETFMRDAIRHMIEFHMHWAIADLPKYAHDPWYETVGLGGLFSGRFRGSSYEIIRFAYPAAFESGLLRKEQFKTVPHGNAQGSIAPSLFLTISLFGSTAAVLPVLAAHLGTIMAILLGLMPFMVFAPGLAKRLREERRRRGWTVVEVAQRLRSMAGDYPEFSRISSERLSRLEAGRAKLTPHERAALSQLYGLAEAAGTTSPGATPAPAAFPKFGDPIAESIAARLRKAAAQFPGGRDPEHVEYIIRSFLVGRRFDLTRTVEVVLASPMDDAQLFPFLLKRYFDAFSRAPTIPEDPPAAKAPDPAIRTSKRLLPPDAFPKGPADDPHKRGNWLSNYLVYADAVGQENFGRPFARGKDLINRVVEALLSMNSQDDQIQAVAEEIASAAPDTVVRVRLRRFFPAGFLVIALAAGLSLVFFGQFDDLTPLSAVLIPVSTTPPAFRSRRNLLRQSA
jgi:transcriptional regulator with XRE-family HTH domain